MATYKRRWVFRFSELDFAPHVNRAGIMPGVTGYQTDIFVSYAHADNDAADDDLPWVSRFVADLERSLRRRLGSSATIYFDERQLSSGTALAELLRHARNSAIFLAIVSPSYVNREWTRDELAAFLSEEGAFARLCPVEFLPLDSEDDYPKEFSEVKRARFWHTPSQAQTAVTVHASLDRDKYYPKIEDLAGDLRQRLKLLGLERPGSPRPPADRPAPQERSKSVLKFMGLERPEPPRPPPERAPPQDRSKTVLLAQVTDDLEEERENVRRHLEQFEIAVLPAAAYPQGGRNFLAAFAADCERASAFVQMLGPVASRSPPDLEASYAQTQYRLAGTYGLRRSLWCRPDTKLDSVKHRDAALLAAPEVEMVGLETFKAELVRKLTTPDADRPARTPAKAGFVFINASPPDLSLAKSISEEVVRYKFSAVLPSFDGSPADIRLDLEENLVDCSALVLVYGSVTPMWVRQQLRLFEKISSRREKPPRVLAIFAGPPEDKPDLGVQMAGVRFIDARQSASPAPIAAVVKELSS
jgi:hypothetical protein